MEERSYLYEFIADWATDLRKRWRGFAIILLVSIVLGLAYAFLAPPEYSAQIRLLPPRDSRANSGVLSQLSGIASIAGPAGLGPAMTGVSLYPEVARSRWVLTRALETEHEGKTFRELFTGEPELGYQASEMLLMAARKRIDASIGPITRVVTIDFRSPTRELTAPFLNAVLEQMGEFFENQLVSEARNRRISIEKRLAEVQTSLMAGEERLEQFLIANRSPALSPSLELDRTRLQRDVEVNSSVYMELKRQLEIARIDEIGAMPTLDVLERAVDPIRRSSPRRSLVMIFALSIGVVLGAGYVRYSEIVAQYRGRKA